MPTNTNTTYYCDTDGVGNNNTKITSNCLDDIYLNNSNKSTFSLMIENNDTNGVYIERVFVIDSSGCQYGIKTFCISSNDQQVVSRPQIITTCTFYTSLTPYDSICVDSDSCGNNPRFYTI